MRIIFMGTPEFAVPTLQALIDTPEHSVVAVYSQPPRPAGRGHHETPSPVHQLAQQHGIAVFTPATLKGPAEQQQFASLGADVAVVAAYGLLLPKPILEACPFGCLNLHPSDLPRWRGAAPIQRTIMAGDTHSAMCIMQMNEGLDTGDVLLRQPVYVPTDTTAGQLHDKMAALGAECLLKTLEMHGRLEPQPQPDHGVTYAKKISKDEALIDWQRPAAEILCHIRGLNPYPAAQCDIAGERVKIFEAVMDDTPSPLSFVCGDGKKLCITELQRPNKKRMSTQDALRGWNLAS